MSLGIERLDAYPAALRLDLEALCEARGLDRSRLMTDARSVNPPWEDPVTMAVNAAELVVDDEIRDQIGLVIVATETGVDLEKSISTWVHRYLELPANARNFEIKHACYGATAAIQMALGWLATQARGRKALIVTTDQSLTAIGKPWEPICGGGATAVVVSDSPELFELHPGKSGVFAHEITDVIRPNLNTETGNSDASMFSYLDALDGAYRTYQDVVGPVTLPENFDWHVYHMPFPGMALTAHRTLCAVDGLTNRRQATASFDERVLAGTRFGTQVGGVYSGSWLLGLSSLLHHAEVTEQQQVSVFSYGSGSCAEFFGLTAGPRTQTWSGDIASLVDARARVDIATYEALELERSEVAGAADFVPSTDGLEDVYERLYAGRWRLVLDRVEGYFRTYRRS